MTFRRHSGLSALCAALAAFACGGGGGDTGPAPTPSAITITLNSISFSPPVDTVAQNGTVTWIWATNTHNVLSDIALPGELLFTSDSAVSNSGHQYQWTFASAGSYRYYCSVHGTSTSGMFGKIVVE